MLNAPEQRLADTFDEDRAIAIGRMWLRDNPARVYRLRLDGEEGEVPGER